MDSRRLKQQLEIARRLREASEEEERRQREQTALLLRYTRPVRLNPLLPADEDGSENSPNHNVPAPRRSGENVALVPRRIENGGTPSVVHINASQAANHHSPLTVSQVSWATSPASLNARARRRRAEESSDDESIDLEAAFLAFQAKKKSAGNSDTSPRATSTADPTDDNSADSESGQKRKSPANSTATSEPAPKPKPPRNPLTMAKMLHAVPQFFPSKSINDDDLWYDSNNEEDSPKSADAKQKSKSKHLKKKRKRIDDSEFDLDCSRPSIGTSFLDLTEDEIANVDLTELKPVFDFPKFTAEPDEPFVLNAGNLGFESPICVPASISRYLPPYQKEGIQFLYDQAVMSGHGAVLGDDMGLGKTVQVIGLLSALLKKKGDGHDLVELIRRKNIAKKKLADFQTRTNNALDQGCIPAIESVQNDQQTLPAWAPILIIAPNSVLNNWVSDFATWGHFSVVEYRGENKESALEKIRLGSAEILLMGKSVITSKGSFPDILSPKGNVKWKLIIVDEFHQFKNHMKNMSKNLRELRNAHTRNVIGLTGTLMQNEHAELWNLVDIVYENFLGTRKEFSKQFGKPIKYGMAKSSTLSTRKYSEEQRLELSNKMPTIYKRRLKEHILKDLLPMKDERVVFCQPTELQVELYKHLIGLPDFDYLRKANLPCGCGVNKRFFVEYKRLASREEKIAYQRRNRNNIIPRKDCCFACPNSEDLPNAIIWRQNHENNEPCEKCPYCIILPALTVLNKLSSHVSLLQVEVPPHQIDERTEYKKWKLANELMDQAEVFLPDSILNKLPGQSRVQKNGLMNEHCELSGKMSVLQKLLEALDSQGRVLLFSSSTQMLNLIEDFIKSKGHSYLRMDGSTDTTSRNEIVEKFKRGNDFIFLLSTKAMGLGLNLTEASFVIIFDVEWNPSWDSQAQDRAYRIGQQKNVKVFRLVTRGTIEELKYLRQVYKTHLTNATIPDIASEPGSARMFDGVAKDKYRHGELFGIANLLKFRPGTFMNYAAITDAKETKKFNELKDVIHNVEALKNTLLDRSEEAEEILFLENFLEEEDVFPNISTKKDDNSDKAGSDHEGMIGGESLLMLDISNEMEDIDDESEDDEELHNVEKTKDDSPVHVAAPVSKPKVAYTTEMKTPDQVISNAAPISSNSSRKKKQLFSSVDMRASGNYSLVGQSAHNLLQKDSPRTSFRMSDFALPNNKGKLSKK